jgi:hypothetical protein
MVRSFPTANFLGDSKIQNKIKRARRAANKGPQQTIATKLNGMKRNLALSKRKLGKMSWIQLRELVARTR